MPVVSSQIALLGKAPVYTTLGMVSHHRLQLLIALGLLEDRFDHVEIGACTR